MTKGCFFALFFFLPFVGLGFEFKVLCLQSRQSTLELHLQCILHWLIRRWDPANYLPIRALNHNPPNLSYFLEERKEALSTHFCI
jgi:hypothetical protein